MDRDLLRNTLLRARWQTARLGTPGKIGFGLMIFSVVFFIVAVLPRRAESSALMGKAEAMKVLMQTKPAMTPGRKIQGDEALQAFYAFFPHIDSSPFWIKELVQVAGQHNVEVNGSDYRMVREKNWKLARYEMALPIRGKYSQVRGFVADALRAVPAMALVDIAIKREGVESELLEASLKFNLYLSEDKR
ncbi:hypothetical protein [Nitrosospira sp. NRS527]|uniref:hypothetical protein n=1 Tax=Nitrosospira sp. NRS527 TaxID=155925 RepID=UPI001AF2A598|nr:hypothetical protein [Nitrosospira sp. NRS527]BCT66645.1 hypothetical protein NNRS527_00211 [Nitrosospira sp. NRS527]